MLKFNIHLSLDGFTLSARGSQTVHRVGLLGLAGAGKTLLLECLAGLRRPGHGYITHHGRRLFDSAAALHAPIAYRHLAYVPPDGQLIPHMTVCENLLLVQPRRNLRMMAELLRVFRLGRVRNVMPDALSPAQCQAAALARALASCPRMILLDDPLRQLDPSDRMETMALYKHAVTRWPVSFIYAGQNPDEVAHFTAACWKMSRGVLWHPTPAPEARIALPVESPEPAVARAA